MPPAPSSPATAPGCNPSQAGPGLARATLDAALAALTAGQTGAIARCALYVAGAPAFWRDYAAGLAGYACVTSDSDALPVLELATGGAAGLVLHCGTGSFIAARAPDGSVHYAGGLGWKLGDPGSGFELGRRGGARALLELQGWAPPSGLGAALQAHTGLEHAGDITRFFYHDPSANARLAAFAPVLFDLAESGCAPALAAVQASLSELADQAGWVLARLFSRPAHDQSGPASAPAGPHRADTAAVRETPAADRPPLPCGLSGAILNRPLAATWLRELAAARHWPVALHLITEPPIEGVRRLLARATAEAGSTAG